MNTNFEYLLQYFDNENITIDLNEFYFQIQSHPDYPSLLSISDTLSFFKINNLATNLENEELVHLPKYFIALIQDQKFISNLVFVEKTTKGYKYLNNNTVIESNEETFLKSFQNVVLLVEKEENEPKKENKSNELVIVGSILFGLLYLALIFINGFSILVSTFICLALVGIYLSYEAISSEFGIKTKFSQAVCSISANSDCKAVLNTVKSKIIQQISFSTVSIAFFSSQIIELLIFSVFNKPIEFFLINSILLLLTIPVIIFSIYHQTLVAKKWCPICMAIILLIVIEFIILIFNYQIQFTVNPIYFATYILLLIGVYSILYFIKNSFKVNLELTATIAQNNRFKRNYSLFKMALIASEKLKIVAFDSEKIILGNPDAHLKITVISSPFCGHCKKSHELISEILDRYNDKVYIQLHFNLNIELSDQNAKELHFKLLQIYFEFGQNQFLKNMHIWFETKDVNKIDAINHFEENENRIIKIIENQYNWNLLNDITFTPAIIINGFHFPKEYDRNDLIYFIEELADDESFNL